MQEFTLTDHAEKAEKLPALIKEHGPAYILTKDVEATKRFTGYGQATTIEVKCLFIY